MTRKILVIDDMPPEANAMVQALYSRDPRSVTEHLARVKEVGADKFMASYYVGYGHKSIGDCGTTTVYIENVSMLVAKAVQDWALYNGQEASTRYLNMAAQPVLNPLDTKEGKALQDASMKLYSETLAELIPFLKERFPRKDDQHEKVWEKAIAAKAFDIARGLLPAGVTTLLSWHSNLRQAHDHLKQLEHHPLEEVRSVAGEIRSQLQAKYSSSFSHKTYEETEKYLDLAAQSTYFDAPFKKFEAKSMLDTKGMAGKSYAKLLANRPPKTELPAEFKKFGNLRFSFLLDFGSYRDLQRHRSMTLPMPLLSTKHGFGPWYLSQLPPTTKAKVVAKLKELEKRIKALKCSPEDRQYYVPMGYRVACEMTLPLPAAIYIAELRSSQTVHPTLRVIAQDMGRYLTKLLPKAKFYCDASGDQWDIKRGTQTIERK